MEKLINIIFFFIFIGCSSYGTKQTVIKLQDKYQSGYVTYETENALIKLKEEDIREVIEAEIQNMGYKYFIAGLRIYLDTVQGEKYIKEGEIFSTTCDTVPKSWAVSYEMLQTLSDSALQTDTIRIIPDGSDWRNYLADSFSIVATQLLTEGKGEIIDKANNESVDEIILVVEYDKFYYSSEFTFKNGRLIMVGDLISGI